MKHGYTTEFDPAIVEDALHGALLKLSPDERRRLDRGLAWLCVSLHDFVSTDLSRDCFSVVDADRSFLTLLPEFVFVAKRRRPCRTKQIGLCFNVASLERRWRSLPRLEGQAILVDLCLHCVERRSPGLPSSSGLPWFY